MIKYNYIVILKKGCDTLTKDLIQAYLAIIEYGSITRAAKELYISQPALTRKIRKLEEQVGFKLINRNKGNRQVTLTDKGKAYVQIASNYLDLLNETATIAKGIVPKKKYKITSSDGPHLYVFPEVYKDFISRYPNVSLELFTATYHECFNQIISGKADIAFTGVNYFSENIVSVPAYSENMYFICRKDSGYPSKIDIKNLKVANSIYSPYSIDFSKWYKYWFNTYGSSFMTVDLIAQVEYFLTEFHKELWSIVPSSVAFKLKKNPLLTIKKLKTEPPKRVIYLIRKIDNESPYIPFFIEIVKEKIKTLNDVTLLL